MSRDSKIPQPAWTIRRLGDVAEIILGGTPSTEVRGYWGGSIPWMSSGEVNKKRVFEVDGFISEAGLAASNATLVDPPTVAIGLAGQGKTRGTAALVNIRLCTNQSIALIKGSDGILDSHYLYHNLDGRYEELRTRSAGGGRAGLSKEILAEVPLPLPDLPEQSRIAAVLDTVDEAIAKTEAVIAKLRQVRAGLLHDLLTCGLESNGKLRDPIAHPELFQDSPLGQIPKDWTTPPLANLCSHIGSGVTPRGGQDVYTSTGIMLIRSQNVAFDGLLLDDVAFISEAIHLGMLRSEVFAHDVLFNITGASIGRCCPMPEDLGTANVNQHVCALRVPKATDADAKYLASLLASPIGQRQMDSLLTVGNRQGLNYQQLGSFLIPWPKEDERKAISSQIYAIEDQIRAEEKENEKQALLKSGLMTDLLTGRVRVPLKTKETA